MTFQQEIILLLSIQSLIFGIIALAETIFTMIMIYEMKLLRNKSGKRRTK